MIKHFDSSITIPGHLVRPLHTESFDLNSDFLRESVGEVYGWANQQLLKVICDKQNMIENFEAVKKFFFGECGDLCGQFLDLAGSELKKSMFWYLLF